MKCITVHNCGMYGENQEAVEEAVLFCQKTHGMLLLFGSMSLRTEPGYNYGGDATANFYNLTPLMAQTIISTLLRHEVLIADIEVRTIEGKEQADEI